MHWSVRAFFGAAMLVAGNSVAGLATAQDMDGNTYPGPYYRGAHNAPVTFDEYADFQ